MAKDRQNGSFERLQEEEDRTLPEPQTSTTGNTQGIELQPSSQQQAGFGATANSDYQHVSNVLGEAFYKAQRFVARTLGPAPATLHQQRAQTYHISCQTWPASQSQYL